MRGGLLGMDRACSQETILEQASFCMLRGLDDYRFEVKARDPLRSERDRCLFALPMTSRSR
jgi:hypothetical protein